MTTIATAVQALLAVWIATTPGPLVPGPGHPEPARGAAGWVAWQWDRRGQGPESLVVTAGAVAREFAVENAESEEDDSEITGTVQVGEQPAFGLGPVNPPPCPLAPPTTRCAPPRPLYLLCSRLTC